MNGKTHLRQMACALFSLYGYEQFSAVKALTLTKHHDLKAMVTFHYTRDIDGHGNYFQFIKNPTVDSVDPVDRITLKQEITRLEAVLVKDSEARVLALQNGKYTRCKELDKRILETLRDMMRKTDEFLK